MSILTKPAVQKGVSATFTISKSALLLHPLVSADSYFSEPLNWYRITAVYKSSQGSQYEIVEFDASQSTPSGKFLVSDKARDQFLIQKVQILDFDGGFLEIPRSSLTAAEWDVTFEEMSVVSYINWDANSDYAFNSEGGFVGPNAGYTGLYDLYASVEATEGAFEYIFNIASMGSGSQIGVAPSNSVNTYGIYKLTNGSDFGITWGGSGVLNFYNEPLVSELKIRRNASGFMEILIDGVAKYSGSAVGEYKPIVRSIAGIEVTSSIKK